MKMQNTTSLVIIDTESHALARRAVDRTLEIFPADEVIIFSDDAEKWAPYSIVPIGKITALADYNRAILADLPNRLKTDFALVIQFDGFAINASAFTDDFYSYDYIGAPWAAGYAPGPGVVAATAGSASAPDA